MLVLMQKSTKTFRKIHQPKLSLALSFFSFVCPSVRVCLVSDREIEGNRESKEEKKS
jgi:hypothetical protein